MHFNEIIFGRKQNPKSILLFPFSSSLKSIKRKIEKLEKTGFGPKPSSLPHLPLLSLSPARPSCGPILPRPNIIPSRARRCHLYRQRPTPLPSPSHAVSDAPRHRPRLTYSLSFIKPPPGHLTTNHNPRSHRLLPSSPSVSSSSREPHHQPEEHHRGADHGGVHAGLARRSVATTTSSIRAEPEQNDHTRAGFLFVLYFLFEHRRLPRHLHAAVVHLVPNFNVIIVM